MRFKYQPKHLAFLRRNYPHLSLSDLTIAFNRHFSLAIPKRKLRAATKNHRIRSGRTGQFEKGRVPGNKGVKGWLAGGRSTDTQFKPGHMPANSKPLGHERICSKDGYILIKVNERNPHTGAPTRYRAKHQVVWEKENGPIPPGHAIKFLDDDKTNCDIGNLILLSRAELCYLNKNGYGELPKELKPSFRALAKLISATHAAGRQEDRP